MVFLLRIVPKVYTAILRGGVAVRSDIRRRCLPFSSSSSASSSLFEQTIDLPPPEYALPVLRSVNDVPPPKEKPSLMQSMQQRMRKHFSIAYQQSVILNAELLFQGALQQASNPYVSPFRIVIMQLFPMHIHISLFSFSFFIKTLVWSGPHRP
jgi:hypothetical protein